MLQRREKGTFNLVLEFTSNQVRSACFHETAAKFHAASNMNITWRYLATETSARNSACITQLRMFSAIQIANFQANLPLGKYLRISCGGRHASQALNSRQRQTFDEEKRGDKFSSVCLLSHKCCRPMTENSLITRCLSVGSDDIFATGHRRRSRPIFLFCCAASHVRRLKK